VDYAYAVHSTLIMDRVFQTVQLRISFQNSHADSLFPSILGISQSDAELSVFELNNENI